MGFLDLAFILSLVVYISTLGRSRDSALIFFAFIAGPSIWFYECYVIFIEPLFILSVNNKKLQYIRLLAIFVSMLLGVVTVLIIKYVLKMLEV
jgi:hypothetical protein